MTSKRQIRKRQIRGKKAAVELQFNWIFVMIAGFVIFAFIIGIAMSQKKSADQGLSLEMMSKILSSIKGEQQSSNTFTEMAVPAGTELTFSCDDTTGYFDVRMKGASNAMQLPSNIIFTPKKLSGNTIQTWTRRFQLPFTAGNFLYLTTQKTAFIIYTTQVGGTNTNGFGNEIEDDWKSTNITRIRVKANVDNFEAVVLNGPNSILANYGTNYKIICFKGACPDSVIVSLHKLNYINIIPATDSLDSYGKVYFYKNGVRVNVRDVDYIAKAGMYGAIFSDDPGFYECQMNRALKQFEIKREIMEKRFEMILEDLPVQSMCAQIWDSHLGPLTAIEGMKPSYSYGDLYSRAQEIENSNGDMIRNSCPTVY